MYLVVIRDGSCYSSIMMILSEWTGLFHPAISFKVLIECRDNVKNIILQRFGKLFLGHCVFRCSLSDADIFAWTREWMAEYHYIELFILDSRFPDSINVLYEKTREHMDLSVLTHPQSDNKMFFNSRRLKWTGCAYMRYGQQDEVIQEIQDLYDWIIQMSRFKPVRIIPYNGMHIRDEKDCSIMDIFYYQHLYNRMMRSNSFIWKKIEQEPPRVS